MLWGGGILTVITGHFGLLCRQAYYRKGSRQASMQSTMQVSGKFWLLILSGRYLLVAVEVASSIYVNQLNATKLKSCKAQI